MGKRKGKRKGKLRGDEAEEMVRNAKREFLARELQLTDVNARKQRLAWRYKMIRLNLPIVREELEAAWHTFDKAFDDRDYRCVYYIVLIATVVVSNLYVTTFCAFFIFSSCSY